MKMRIKELNLNKSVFLLILFITTTGCQDYESNIPDMPVYVVRNIDIINIGSPGQSYLVDRKIATESYGFGGIIIVHGLDENYYAFDLACPVEVNRAIRVRKTNRELVCKCDSCGEEYDLSFGDGTPTKNISKKALRRYSVSITANNNIIVTR